MARLAGETQAFCKVSGLVTEAAREWRTADLRPYFEHVRRHFGAGRLVWGSDWPVCTLAASYEAWRVAAVELASGLSQSDQDALFGGNCAALYRLGLSQ
jgi:L-fuconolactonase